MHIRVLSDSSKAVPHVERTESEPAEPFYVVGCDLASGFLRELRWLESEGESQDNDWKWPSSPPPVDPAIGSTSAFWDGFSISGRTCSATVASSWPSRSVPAISSQSVFQFSPEVLIIPLSTLHCTLYKNHLDSFDLYESIMAYILVLYLLEDAHFRTFFSALKLDPVLFLWCLRDLMCYIWLVKHTWWTTPEV
ncbi:hypothetical protein CERSUDRAFT_75317 [Gelatoporia subvermispora B]|uniref:Uncharacterized protein n=1 Tax=Ceriporiopsis subvermispora (strain B) TaxID=914234 RepID=M2QSI4_CERS8|nr:hypothetical protein CERSUDRAFT_75317 [Gelatoporia subvermispora B]